MKYFILISALIAVTVAQNAPVVDIHGAAPVHKKCQDDPVTHVDELVFEKIMKHEKVDLPENFGKHVLCMTTGMNMTTPEGKVNTEGVKTHVQHVITDAHAVDEIVRKCCVDKETPEVTAKDLYKCLSKHHVMGSQNHHGHKKHGDRSSEESNESHSNESHEHGHHGHH